MYKCDFHINNYGLFLIFKIYSYKCIYLIAHIVYHGLMNLFNEFN